MRSALRTAALIPGRILRSTSSSDAFIQSLLAQLIILLVNVTSGVITARLLGPEGRGIFAAVTLWPVLFALIATAGLTTALPFQANKYPSDARAIFGIGIAAGATLGVFAAALAAALMPYLLPGYGNDAVFMAQLATLVIIPSCLHLIFNSALIGIRRFRLFNATRVLTQAAFPVGLLVFMLFGELDWQKAVVAQITLPNLMVALALPFFWQALRPSISAAWPLLVRLVSFSARSAPADILSTLSFYADRIILIPLLSPAVLGYYVVGFALSRVVTMMVPTLNTLLLSRMAGLDQTEAKALHDLAFRLSFWLLLLIGGAIAACSPWLIELLYGSAFAPVVPVFIILLVEAGVYCLTHITFQFFNSQDRPGVVSLLQALSFVVTIVAVMIFAQRYGAIGAAASVLIASTFRLVAALWGLNWWMRLSLPPLRLTTADVRYVQARLLGESALGRQTDT